jgi:hypothetical protein
MLTRPHLDTDDVAAGFLDAEVLLHVTWLLGHLKLVDQPRVSAVIIYLVHTCSGTHETLLDMHPDQIGKSIHWAVHNAKLIFVELC